MRKSKKLYKHDAAKKRRKRRASTRSVAARKKHHKPFRFRHLSLIILALFIGSLSVFQLGVYFGKSQSKTQPVASSSDSEESRVMTVRSSYGFSFSYDKELMHVAASAVQDTVAASVPEAELHLGKPIVSVSVASNGGATLPRDAAAELTILINEDKKTFATARSSAAKSLSDAQVAAQMYEVQSDKLFNVTLLTQGNETLNGSTTIKRVYQYTPRVGSIKSRTYSVQWTGVLHGRAFAIHVRGLIDDSNIPATLQGVLNSLSFSSKEGVYVLGAATHAASFDLGSSSAQEPYSNFVIEGVSPAVVKIYHATCGSLVAFNQRLGSETCNLTTGSGFFVSSNGYIATNGHVVTYSAEDAFVSVLLSNPNTLSAFLKQIVGMDAGQVSSLSQNPTLLAALIAEIYDLPDDTVRIANESHTYFVALGDEPLKVGSIAEAYKLRDRVDSHQLKKAKLVATNYASKDLYSISADDKAGFSSSDVALLKVPVRDSPFVRFFDGTVTQNMDITVVGFPGDAENILIDTSTLSTSATSGSISAIRETAGGQYTLYQSDADASGGNSGGPALSEEGHVLGLLTYRFKNDTQQDAAKSYIRAIEDLQALAQANNITFAQNGSVQTNWETGLNLYAQNHFSEALMEFEKVQEAYPAHRLVDTYIANASQAIAEGRDVKNFPAVIAASGTIALAALGFGIVLAVRHHGHHQKFKLSQQGAVTQLVSSHNGGEA